MTAPVLPACRVRIVAFDTSANWAADISDTSVAIVDGDVSGAVWYRLAAGMAAGSEAIAQVTEFRGRPGAFTLELAGANPSCGAPRCAS